MSYASRRDKPHAEIRDALRQAGAYVEDASRDPKRGYDLLVVFRRKVVFAEIKTPEKRDNLTDNEIETRHEIVNHGGAYVVWCSVDEALESIGAKA